MLWISKDRSKLFDRGCDCAICRLTCCQLFNALLVEELFGNMLNESQLSVPRAKLVLCVEENGLYGIDESELSICRECSYLRRNC